MSAPPNTYNTLIFQGSTFTRSIKISQTVSGVKTAVNLTGYTLRGQMRRSFASSTVELDLGSYLSITDAANGTFQLEIPATTTQTLTGCYVYDIEIVNGAFVGRPMQGTLDILKEVTR